MVAPRADAGVMARRAAARDAGDADAPSAGAPAAPAPAQVGSMPWNDVDGELSPLSRFLRGDM